MGRRTWIRGLVLLLCLLCLSGCGADEDSGGQAAPAGKEDGRGKEIGRERARFFSALRAGERAEKAGRLEEALSHYEKALTLRPVHETATLGVVRILSARGDREGALLLLERLREARPEIDRPAFLMGELLVSERPGFAPDPWRALACFEETCRANPHDSGPWLRLAHVQLMLGDAEGAQRSYRTVLGTNPKSVEALVGLAGIALDSDRPKVAVPLLLRALDAGTRASGRADVPSEMDTHASFVDAEATSAKNIRAFVALARAVRALGGYPEEVPRRFRLPDLERLGPVGEDLVLETQAGGFPLLLEGPGLPGRGVLLPGGEGSGHPVILVPGARGIRKKELASLPARGSAALFPLDEREGSDLLLGSWRPEDPRPILLVGSFDSGGAAAGEPTELSLGGRLLGAAPQGSGFAGVLLARVGAEGPSGLLLLERVAAGKPALRVLDERLPVDVACAPAAVFALFPDGEILRFRSGEDGGLQKQHIAHVADEQAACIALADVTGDGLPDLLLGRAATEPAALRALVGADEKPAPTLRYLKGLPGGRFATTFTTLPDLPPLVLRRLLPLDPPDSPFTRLLAVCGSEDPAAFTPSVFLLPGPQGSCTTLPVPLASTTHAGAFAAILPQGFGSRLLLLRGGLVPGNLRPPALVPLPKR